MPHRANSSLQDIFVRKLVKRIKEKVSENDMWVDGQFMSEKDMRDDGIEEQPSCTRPFQTASQSLIWVCLKIAYPYTQWLMIIIPTKWL